MKRNSIIFTSVLLLIIAISIVGASLAWFSVDIRSGTDSLSFNISSEIEMVVTFAPEDLKISMTPAEATIGAVAAGYTVGTGEDCLSVDVDKYIVTPASIGVAKASMLYLGSQSGQAEDYMMSVSCGMYTGAEGATNVTGEVMFMVFACGENFSMGTEWLLGYNNDSVIRSVEQQKRSLITQSIYDEDAKRFIDYNFTDDINSNNFYLLSTNINDPDILMDFGIQGMWTNGNLEQAGYTIVLEKMNLEFMVVAWYNKVDELLDPLIQQSDVVYITLGIAKDASS